MHTWCSSRQRTGFYIYCFPLMVFQNIKVFLPISRTMSTSKWFATMTIKLFFYNQNRVKSGYHFWFIRLGKNLTTGNVLVKRLVMNASDCLNNAWSVIDCPKFMMNVWVSPGNLKFKNRLKGIGSRYLRPTGRRNSHPLVTKRWRNFTRKGERKFGHNKGRLTKARRCLEDFPI